MRKQPIGVDLQEFSMARGALEKMSRECDRLRITNKFLEQELTALQSIVAVVEHIPNVVSATPAWVTKSPGKGKLHHGMPTLLLSDCHFDEVVNPAEVEGVNAYNRKIALQRLHRTRDRIEMLTDDFFQGITYEGIVVMLGGDMLSGAIHEELVETNETTVYSSLDFWADEIAGFINSLQTKYKNVRCVGVVGNHGRRTRKPVMKRRVRDNLDWLLYRIAAGKTPNVTWDIPESADVDVPIYQTRFRLTHGDQFHGGGGIAGMLSPILLGHHRKVQQQMAVGKPAFDWMVLGHWHQYFAGRGIIVNGALKGYDEYAYMNNFRYEQAQQAFWITTPEHGVAFTAPIFCADRKAEKW